jgi:hypothetical protein
MVQILWKAVSKVGQTASVTTYFLRKSFPLFFFTTKPKKHNSGGAAHRYSGMDIMTNQPVQPQELIRKGLAEAAIEGFY